MKFRMWFALTVCSVLIPGFATAAAPAKKATRAGSLVIADDPALPIPVVPVAVQNFPAVQAVGGTVSVDNLPAVQSVAGTVSIDNLPAVQDVGGTVSVSNLPLDGDGAVRVSSGTGAPARHIVMYELMPYYTPGSNFVALPEGIDTSGYSAIGVRAIGVSGYNIDPQVYWQFVSGDDFTQVNGILPGAAGMTDCGAWDPSRRGTDMTICANYGARPGVVLNGGGDHTASVRLYLIP